MVGLTKRQRRLYDEILRGRMWCPYASMFNIRSSGDPKFIAAHEAYLFARIFGRKRGVDVKRLQRIVMNTFVPNLWYKFARDVEGANIKKLETLTIKYGEASLMKKFSLNIPKANREKLEAFIMIKEVMEM